MTRTSRRSLVPLTIAWACMVALVGAGTIDCSIEHRSQDFTCATTADCDSGRVCDNGFCVVGGGGGSGSSHVDAGVDGRAGSGSAHPDASTCPSTCASCNDDDGVHTCVIDCAHGSQCNNGPVKCPAGFHCDIECDTQGGCKTVSCADADSCDIHCSGQNSCGTVSCGAGACNVTCDGKGSCKSVACGESCKCDVACENDNACQSVICSSVVCGTFDGGCDSTARPSCDTCP